MLKFIFKLLILIAILLGLAYWKLTAVTQYIANFAAYEYFDRTIRLQDVKINKDLQLTITGITGTFRDGKTALPIYVGKVKSIDSLQYLLMQHPVAFSFREAKPARSELRGVDGQFIFNPEKNLVSVFDGYIQGIDLKDLTWINPENLQGSNGILTGKVHYKNRGLGNAPDFSMNLKVTDAGGHLQARFFDWLGTFVPEVAQNPRLKAVKKTGELVFFKDGKVDIELQGENELKFYIHMQIPEYNVELNLNVSVLIDKPNAFMELAQVLGLFEVKI